MRFMQLLFFICLIAMAIVAPSAWADVIALANRTPVAVAIEVKPLAGPTQRWSLSAGDVVPVFVDGRAHVSFASRGEVKRYLLNANSAYYFGQAPNGRLDLQQIGLGEDQSTSAGRPLPGNAASGVVATIPVRILVDEEEPARQQHWERRLRARVEAASAVLEKHACVGLKVVGVGTWQSNNATTDFFESLSEFESKVKPFPARLAIGFTSQYQVVKGRVHMAGTRGSLHSHILVREWSQHMSEPERLELLLHELGHFLGASHSPESNSVMRPVLGDRQAVRSGFQVRFDPVNTLIMSMVGEEIGRRRIQKSSEMSSGSKLRLRQIYQALTPTMPTDQAASNFAQRLSVPTATPLIMGTKQIVAQIVSSARANSALPVAVEGITTGPTRRTGDALTNYYVQQAAGISRFLPDNIATSSFLLGLGIALDDTQTLRNHPKYGAFVRSVEADYERSLRLSMLGDYTMRGRADLAKQFVVAAHMAALAGTPAATTEGLSAELAAAQGATVFSFADIAANRAGALFADGVSSKRFTLLAISEGFTVPTYMPSVEGLPDALSAAELAAQFGALTDSRFRAQLQRIDQRLLQLPPYRKPEIALER